LFDQPPQSADHETQADDNGVLATCRDMKHFSGARAILGCNKRPMKERFLLSKEPENVLGV
jgi:hypothetical protein